MLNRSPIFIIGFPRGGTTMLLDLIWSHPEVSTLRRETHEVFYGRKDEPVARWVYRISYLPILLDAQQHIFSGYLLQERNDVSRPMKRYIDLLFYISKMSRRGNRAVNETGQRSWSDVSSSRLLCKNLNGLAFTSDILLKMYPDATFIALVRDGFALCEGWMRRGRSVEYAGTMYSSVSKRMIDDAQRIENYHIIYFEDLIAEPAAIIRKVYGYAGLNIDAVEKFGLQSKESMDKDGIRRVTFGQRGQRVWSRLGEIEQYVREDVNVNQIARLKDADKEAFLRYAREPMEYFGYLGARALESVQVC